MSSEDTGKSDIKSLFDAEQSAAELPSGETLADLQIAADEHPCCQCRDKSRSIFGEGSANARLMFIGESPSPEDAVVGRPFLGPTGEILNKIITAIGFKREDCYLCNVLKCPMPGRTQGRSRIH